MDYKLSLFAVRCPPKSAGTLLFILFGSTLSFWASVLCHSSAKNLRFAREADSKLLLGRLLSLFVIRLFDQLLDLRYRLLEKFCCRLVPVRYVLEYLQESLSVVLVVEKVEPQSVAFVFFLHINVLYVIRY